MLWQTPNTEAPWIDPSILSTWVPISIAIIALVLAVVTAWQNWRHNKLSVKPLLNFSFLISTSPYVFQAKLENNGTGPAIITEIRMRLDGEPVEQPNSQLDWTRLFQRMGIDTDRMAHFGLSLALKNVIKAGEDRELIKLYDFTGEDLKQLHLKTAKALSRLKLQYCYTSIYGGKDAWKTAFAALE